MILEQLLEKLNDGDYIYLYDLNENFLYGGCHENCPETYFSCRVEDTDVGYDCLFITLRLRMVIFDIGMKKDFTEALEKATKLIYDDAQEYKPLTPEMMRELAKRLWGIDIDEQR